MFELMFLFLGVAAHGADPTATTYVSCDAKCEEGRQVCVSLCRVTYGEPTTDEYTKCVDVCGVEKTACAATCDSCSRECHAKQTVCIRACPFDDGARGDGWVGCCQHCNGDIEGCYEGCGLAPDHDSCTRD